MRFCAPVLLLAASLSAAGERYALVVAVRQYDATELKPLKYTENDAKALADTFKSAGYRRVVVLTQSLGAKEARYLPTAANVRRELAGLLEDRAEDDGVVVAFAGHGVQFAGEDESYFCPMDTKLNDRASLVALGEVYAELKACPAGFKLLMADVCRSDPRPDFGRSIAVAKLASVSRPQVQKPPEGVAAFFSCTAGEEAYESPKLERGVFFHYVVEGLRGKAANGGEVTLYGLAEYVTRRVSDRVRDEFGADVRQRPEMIGQTSGAPVLIGRVAVVEAKSEPKEAPKEEPKKPAAEESPKKPHRHFDKLRRIFGKKQD